MDTGSTQTKNDINSDQSAGQSNTEAYKALLKDYEKFAYIVSHDLRAPTRHITEFSQLLVNHLGDDLDDKTAQYVDFIKKAATKLQSMQSVLLDFSGITTQAKEHEAIESRDLLEYALESLKLLINENVTIDIGHAWPSTYGEKGQLSLVFTHILKNALTYHEDGTDKKISIQVNETDNEAVFSIADNGIGIEPEHYENVFTVFRRLHIPEAYGGGDGAGLMLSKKVIERHGGKIWIEENSPKGTKVSFSLPRRSE